MTNLLIPTDFTNKSLQLAEQAVKAMNGEQVNVILFHAFAPAFYFDDMLLNINQPYRDLMTDDYRQACKQLKEQYPRLINKIMFKFMHGDTRAMFRNFIDANEINLIACPENYVHSQVHKRSVNPVQLFRKCSIPVMQQFSARPAVTEMATRQQEMSYAVVSNA